MSLCSLDTLHGSTAGTTLLVTMVSRLAPGTRPSGSLAVVRRLSGTIGGLFARRHAHTSRFDETVSFRLTGTTR